MSKRTVYKADELPLETSPITKKGEIVYSSIREIRDPSDITTSYIETITPDAEDAKKVLRFLDEQNGIGWTDELKRIEKELRTALLDLMSAEGKSR
jgi:hypothetical protein